MKLNIQISFNIISEYIKEVTFVKIILLNKSVAINTILKYIKCFVIVKIIIQTHALIINNNDDGYQHI